MANLSIKVQDFEGPLDLLIHLIEKEKIDIYDIPIVAVTEQYIEYLQAMTEFDIEIASEFLLMAATLLQIKSRMLLPKQTAEGEEDETDPRQLLVEMLVEYRRIKVCASNLAELKLQAERCRYRLPLLSGFVERSLKQYEAAELISAMLTLLSVKTENTAYIERQEFNVQDKMNEIVHMLSQHLNGVEFAKVFSRTGSRSEKVASFLAVLELLKLGVVTINQTVAFAPIYIYLRQGERKIFHDYLRGSLEALLFAAGEPLSVAKLAEIMQLDKPQVWELLSLLERDYEDEKRGLYLRKVAEGYQLCTKEQHYELIKQLARSQEMKLSNAAMETLAIIAFKQPVTRSEMEAIRGVKVDGVVNTLLEYGLISEAGRKDSIGHPILYGTTDKFLITFGLNSLKDLPDFPDILSEHENEPEQMSLMAEFNEELNKTEETEDL